MDSDKENPEEGKNENFQGNMGKHGSEKSFKQEPNGNEQTTSWNRNDTGKNAEPAEAATDSHFDVFPWNFVQEWPITREARIQELQKLNTHFKDTLQKDNVKAAIDWHSEFPAEEFVPKDQVFFQNGIRYKEEEDVPEDGGFVWVEGGPEGLYMDSGPSLRLTPLGSPSNATEQTGWSYYDKPTGDYMYQLKLEIKVLGRNGGNGQTFSMDVSYDSGCQSMAFPYSEAQPMLTQAATSNLQPVMANTASGTAIARRMRAHAQIMSHDRTKVVLDWKPVLCNLYSSISARIFRGKLAKYKFVCEHPHMEQLWVASSKHELYQKMPK